MAKFRTVKVLVEREVSMQAVNTWDIDEDEYAQWRGDLPDDKWALRDYLRAGRETAVDIALDVPERDWEVMYSDETIALVLDD